MYYYVGYKNGVARKFKSQDLLRKTPKGYSTIKIVSYFEYIFKTYLEDFKIEEF